MLSLNNNKNYGRSTGRVRGNHPFHGPMSFTGFITQIYIYFFNDIVPIQNHKTRRIALYIILPIDNITVYSFFKFFIYLICVNALGTQPLFYSIFIDLICLYTNL